MSHEENDLLPSELERLSILMEEMAEVIHIIGKIQRHGYESYHPENSRVLNRQLLEKEIGHVSHAINLMIANKDIDAGSIDLERANKKKKILQYLHFAHETY